MSGKRSIAAREYLLEFVVGAFFFAALAILATYTVILKRDDLVGERFQRLAEFTNVGSLKEGDPILLRGMHSGKVKALEVTDDGLLIQVQLTFNRPLKFYQDYLVEVRSSSILGGRHVYVELGTPAAGELADDAVFKGSSPADVMVEAGKVMGNLNEAITDIKVFVKEVRTAEGTLHKLIHDDALYTDAKAAMVSVKDAGDKVGKAAGDLEGIGTKLEDTLAGAKDVFKSLQSAGDSVKTAADEVKATSTNLNATITDAREGKGTIGKLLTDDTLYNDLKGTAADLREVAKKAADQGSTLGKIMNDDGQLYDTVKQAFASMETTMGEARTVVDKVNKGEGSLGKIVNDDALYNEVRDTVKSVQGAINDFREQTPILTFGSFIFGAM